MKLEKPTFGMIIGGSFILVILYLAGVGAFSIGKGLGWWY